MGASSSAALDAFRTTARLLPEPLVLVATGGTVRAGNAAAAELLGLDERDLPGWNLAAMLVAETPEQAFGYLRACARTRSLLPGTMIIDRPGKPRSELRAEGSLFRPRSDDEEALVLLRLSPKGAAVARFVELSLRIDELSREIARRRRVEEDLRLQREWFQVVLSSIGDAVIATDAGGLVEFINPVAQELTGWTQAAACGRTLREVFRIVNEDSRLEVENPAEKVLREGVIVGLANHTVLIARDGVEWPIDDSAAPIRDNDGEMRGVVLVFREIHDRRRMERELHVRAERLAEQDRRKDEFLAMLAHELRNPMAPLVNVLEIFKLSKLDNQSAELAWGLQVAERQVNHMKRMVDDLLDVSRVTLGKITLHRRRVHLATVVEHARELAQPLVERRRHTLSIALPPRTIALDADPGRLAQILANLLNNAAKYTEEGGLIRLEAAAEGGWVEVRVRDNGIGIEPELLGSIFELFTQSNCGLDRAQGGLGIGLALVRALAELHGGVVEARSDGPGTGSEFLVRLPMAEEEHGPSAPDAGPAQGTAATRRVLIVDDNHDSARSLAKLLGRWGHDVRLAYDGDRALGEAEDFRPEIVLLDIGLPGMDGYEVAAQLRRRADFNGMRLVGLSGYGQEVHLLRARDTGFDAYLVKPVNLDELRSILRGMPGG